MSTRLPAHIPAPSSPPPVSTRPAAAPLDFAALLLALDDAADDQEAATHTGQAEDAEDAHDDADDADDAGRDRRVPAPLDPHGEADTRKPPAKGAGSLATQGERLPSAAEATGPGAPGRAPVMGAGDATQDAAASRTAKGGGTRGSVGGFEAPNERPDLSPPDRHRLRATEGERRILEVMHALVVQLVQRGDLVLRDGAQPAPVSTRLTASLRRAGGFTQFGRCAARALLADPDVDDLYIDDVELTQALSTLG